MANVAAIVIGLLVVAYIGRVIQRRRRGLVAERGIGIGADLEGLGDVPHVRVRAIERIGGDRLHVVFTPEEGSGQMEYDVAVGEDEFAAEVLDGWWRSDERVAIVLPPGSHLIRLRSVASLQHLTLRRDET